MPPSTKVRLAHSDGTSQRELARHFNIARDSVRKMLASLSLPRADANTLGMMKEIDRVFTKYPLFGCRQIAAYLRRKGGVMRRQRVRRLMAKMGFEAIYKRPRTSQPYPQHPVFPYLLRKLQINRPNQVWCADMTFMPGKNDFLYLVAIMDWATRGVLS